MGLMGVLTVSGIHCEGMSPKHAQKGIIYSTSERVRQLYVTVQMEFQSKVLKTHRLKEPDPPKTTDKAKKGNHASFDKNHFHFVLHDVEFRNNNRGGKNVVCIKNFQRDGEEEEHETDAEVVLRVYDDRSGNGIYGVGGSKADKYLGKRVIRLNEFVKSDNHYFMHEFSLTELEDYKKGENRLQEARKLAVKLEWRLAKKRL